MSDIMRPHDWEEPVKLPEPLRPKRVLVPFDGSHNGERALVWSVLVARNNDAEVVVVVAFEPPLTLRGRGAAYVEGAKAQLAEEATDLASEAVQLLEQEGVRARGIAVKGDVARAILDTAEEEEVDMIILGRHGLTHEMGGAAALDRFRELLSGGIAEKVNRHAHVPVLTVV